MKNVHTWSSTSTPAPNKQGMSSSRPTRTRSTRTGNSTPAPSTPIQVQVQAAPSYVQPMYHQAPVAVAPVPQYQQPQYVAPTYVQQPIAPVPVAPYIPPISNPPKAPLPTKPQALETSYSSRMKTGTSLLMQPVLQTTTQTLLGTRSTRRGAVINYADPGSGDDLPDAGELDSGDSDFAASGGTRQSLRQQAGGTGRSGGGGMGVFNTQTGVGSGYASPAPQPPSDQLDQSYLGMVPPARFIKPRLMVPTPHEYP